jgi:hypothetical protein
MAATAAQCGWLMLPENTSNFQPIKDFCKLTSDKRMSGILCTVWEDSSPHFETVWRGLHDFALFSWNYEDVQVEAAHAAFRHRFYAPALEPEYFNTQDMLEKGLRFWSIALLDEGTGNGYSETFKLIDLPEKDKINAWTIKNKEKLELAKNAVTLYQSVNTRLAEAMDLSRRNRYALEVFNQINELEVYPSNLLLLLQKYDESSLKDRQENAAQIKKFVQEFAGLRSRFESVYSETRLMGNPPGYLLDSNFAHHRANRTNNTDWMFVNELAMNAKIMDWLSKQGNLHGL